MGGAHSHHGEANVGVSVRARVILLTALFLCALGTLAGLRYLWPDSGELRAATSEVQYAAPGVTFPDGAVRKVMPACETGMPPTGSADLEEALGGAPRDPCGFLRVEVLEGEGSGQVVQVNVPPEQSRSGLRPGDVVQLLRTPSAERSPATYSFFGVDRSSTMWVLVILFVLAVGVVARLRGLLALVGLGIGGLVLVKFMLPALLLGSSGLGVALIGAAAIMFPVLYLAHGPSIRTSAALAGTLVGIGLTAFIGVVAVRAARLSGITDEGGAILSTFIGDVSFQGLLICALIVAGLGVLNDVTITQTSAVWELRAAAPAMTRRRLFASGMRIGRDHIASTIYTIVFAYGGTALSVLLLQYLYQRPAGDLLTTEEIATEVITTLSTAIGLVLAVPVTTAIAVLTVGQTAAKPTQETGEL
jgi:uncharacterized membrane protein